MNREPTHRPVLSIGMPVFNAERYIEQALDSILGQSFRDLELIIADNASTDRTPIICKEYAERDPRIIFVRNRMNYGVVYNFNLVYRMTGGRYFKWAAADDICGPEYFSRAVEILEKDPSIVLAWAKTQGIDEEGQEAKLQSEVSDLNSETSLYSPDPVTRFRRLLQNIWWVDGPFYGVMRADTLAKTGLHRNHTSGDQMLVTEMSLQGRCYEIPDCTFFTRVHTEKTSRVRTRRERAVLFETDPAKKKRFVTLKLIRLYASRIAVYLNIILTAPMAWRMKLVCGWEVLLVVLRWARRPGRGAY